MEDLPDLVMVEILSRLPVKTIIHCKCVCKNWRNIVFDSYFADLHLSRSPAGIMVHHIPEKTLTDRLKPGVLKWVEVEDEIDHHHLHHDPAMRLDIASIFQTSCVRSVGSVNGLICLREYGFNNSYFICNPITREYMILPRQRYGRGSAVIDHGFGVGSLNGEYKVIRISREYRPWTSRQCLSEEEAEVYTLGTGQWRSLGKVPYRIIGSNGAFLNGHAHWFVGDNDSSETLYAFDFDNETFKLFPSPPIEKRDERRILFKRLAVLKGCLCQCQSETLDYEFTIWVMKEYGMKKSWHKDLVIKKSMSRDVYALRSGPVHLIERLRDGTILMLCSDDKLLAYNSQGTTIANIGYYDPCFTGIAYRPSFLKLRNFESERVHVL